MLKKEIKPVNLPLRYPIYLLILLKKIYLGFHLGIFLSLGRYELSHDLLDLRAGHDDLEDRLLDVLHTARFLTAFESSDLVVKEYVHIGAILGNPVGGKSGNLGVLDLVDSSINQLVSFRIFADGHDFETERRLGVDELQIRYQVARFRCLGANSRLLHICSRSVGRERVCRLSQQLYRAGLLVRVEGKYFVAHILVTLERIHILVARYQCNDVPSVELATNEVVHFTNYHSLARDCSCRAVVNKHDLSHSTYAHEGLIIFT